MEMVMVGWRWWVADSYLMIGDGRVDLASVSEFWRLVISFRVFQI